jgi:beta-lactamase regulating signal transducer with metallopeptidase domain
MNHWQLPIELTLKGIMILAAAGLLSVGLRKASAASRHVVWSLALGALLLLPAMTWAVPAWRVAILPAPPAPPAPIAEVAENASPDTETSAAVAERPPLALPGGRASIGAVVAPQFETASAPLTAVAPAWQFNAAQIALLIWAAGVALVSARLLLGMLRMRRITRDAERLIDYPWSMLTNRLRGQLNIRDHVAIYVSAEVAMPMTWGVLIPVIVLPPESYAWSAEWRRVVLLHELAHIKRRDCLTQTLAHLACALYWFNPLVWFAARRLRVERELACDDCVLEVGAGASDYANYLVEIAQTFESVEPVTPVSVGMACSQLENRVRAILDPQLNRRHPSRRRKATLAVAMACALCPLAALKATSQERISLPVADAVAVKAEAPNVTAEVVASTAKLAAHQDEFAALRERAANHALTAPERAELTRTEQTIASLQGELRGASAVTPAPQPDPLPAPLPLPAPRPLPAPDPNTAPAPGFATVAPQDAKEKDKDKNKEKDKDKNKEKDKDEGLTVENLIRLRMYNVTPEYIEAIKKAGYEDATARQVAELKMHDITPDYIKQAQSMSGEKLSVRELVQMKISGLNPEYIAAMRQAGYGNLPARKLSQMRLMGVTPEFAAAMKRAGFDNLTAEQLTQLKAFGITEEYVRQVQGWGLGKLSMREVVETKIHGVKPEDAQALKALGFDNVSLRDLTRVRMFGVTESYVKELRGLGFDKLTLEQVIRLKQFGVDAEYIRKLRAAGFKNISSNDLLKLKAQGLDAILLKNQRQ